MADKNFVVYKSSAGSGKTYSLVKEYLKIVLTNPDKFSKIICITFTNKAANEMKERIIDALRLLNALNLTDTEQKKINNIKHDILAETNITDETLKVNAAIIQQKLLHNYTDFKISTIDSFMQKIIRSFAIELRLAADYEVSIDSDKILKEVVNAIISFANKDEDITNALINFIEHKTDDNKSFDISADLLDFASVLNKENFYKGISLLKGKEIKDYIEISNKLRSEIIKTEKDFTQRAQKAIEVIENAGLSPNDFYQGSKGLPILFKNIPPVHLAFTINKYSITIITGDSWYTSKTAQKTKDIIDSIKAELKNLLLPLCEKIQQYNSYCSVYKSLFPLALLNKISDE